ncbi:MAG: Rrf2 family transcriptional regulator [Lachnospiraceae bacterium]|nr:Rrf2 family transcriptional regulator [Lachnospiraceae bacterium]
MRISTKGRYALRLMIDLAQHDTGEYIALKDISKRQDITVKYLEQIVAALSRAGFLHSMRGAGGGYRLAGRPEEIRVGDILRTMEGDLTPVDCPVLNGNGDCSRAAECTTIEFWRGLDRVMSDYLDSHTLYDLSRRSDGDDYQI